jgi:hypothetical protein
MKRAIALLGLLILAGCATTNDRFLDSDSSQVQMRQMQTRSFETTDKEKVMRAVISTMQDLGFVVEKADALTGTVSGTKFLGKALQMTAVVRARDASTITVRTNAQYGLDPVTTPESYQDFFSALSKAMFLQANAVD